jgi:hypothetical protein
MPKPFTTRNRITAPGRSGGSQRRGQDASTRGTPCLVGPSARPATPAAVDAQRSKINTLEIRASAVICERVRPEHDKLASAICAKLLEVYDLNVKYTGLLDAVTDKGASTASMPVLQSQLQEHPNYHDSAIGYSFRATPRLESLLPAAQAGFFILSHHAPAAFLWPRHQRNTSRYRGISSATQY